MDGAYGALSETTKGKEKEETVEAGRTIRSVEGKDKPSAAGGPSPDDIEANAGQRDEAKKLQKKIDDVGESTHNTASRNISSVPTSTKDREKRFNEPRAVAIGPYHRTTRDDNFRITYVHKSWCAKHIIGEEYERDLGNKLKEREQDALGFYRDRYREDYPKMDPESFLEMLMLDSCFILFVLSWEYDSTGVLNQLDQDSFQLLDIMWASELIKSDLLLFDNQIPFSIIDYVFNEGQSDIIDHLKEKASNVIDVALKFFDTLGLGRGNFRTDPKKCSNLLQLYYLSLSPRSVYSLPSLRAILLFAYLPLADPLRFIPSATELRRKSAVNFKVAKMVGNDEAQSVLDITTSKYCGDIQMPTLYVFDYTDILLYNLIRFEQPRAPTKSPVAAYVAFMDRIVRKEGDVELLEESGVLEHRLTGPEEVVALFRKFHDVIDRSKSPGYLHDLYKEVINSYNSKWRRRYADAQQRYCSSVWLSISFVAGMVLSILTFITTIYSIISFYQG